MNENKQNGSDPVRGTHQATVQESAELLKRLSEFTSKKEDLLKRISAISDKMQEKLNSDKDPNAEVDIPDFLKQAPFQPPPMLMEFKYTRTREVTAPIVNEAGWVYMFMPSEKSVTDEWIKNAGLSSREQVKDNGIELQPGQKIKLQMGIKIAIPKDFVFYLTSPYPTIEVVSEKIIAGMNPSEVQFSLKNEGDIPVCLEYDKVLIMAYPLTVPAISCEELLNSTFDSYIKGTVK